MNPLNAIKKYFQAQVKKAFDPTENIDLNNVGWHSIGGSTTYGFYQDHQYENGYSSIRVLAEGFSLIEPYTIDKNAKRVPSNILDRVYTPNNDMSAVDFREALMVCTLVHDKVRLRVHHTGDVGTQVTSDTILGFTFMEDFSEDIREGKRYYRMSNGTVLTDTEVITLKNINPDKVTDGFSPSRAARRWTRLDDYIADYQNGFFENGAVPTGQMIITARTSTEFNDIVDMMQSRHKGAGRNNNITYTHRPTDQNGAPLNSQIEWVPFSTQNKDMALKDLFLQVNQKIDSAYGVPASIRAVNDQNTYASVRVDELILVKYGLSPKTLKIWSKFTHELNRICNGTGVAFTYDLDMPVIADEEKVKSESRQIDATTVSTLVAEGYTLDSAIAYVNTGELNSLIIGDVLEPEQPEVTDSEEIKESPDQPIDPYLKSFLSMQEYFDKKFDKLADKVVVPTEKEVVTKQLADVDRELYEFQLGRVIRRQMTRQVEKAILKLDQAIKSKKYGDTTVEEDKEFTAEMLSLMLPLIALHGNRAVSSGIGLVYEAGLRTQDIQKFELTPSQRKAYEKYVAKVGVGYAEQTAEQIRQVLGQGILEQQTRAEIEAGLRQAILGADNQYRIERLARTEVNLSEGKASVYAMENIQEQTGYIIEKIWTITDGACEYCQALDGTVVGVEENFVDKGDIIEGVEGGILNNDFTDTDTAQAHPNCSCYTTYQVRSS